LPAATFGPAMNPSTDIDMYSTVLLMFPFLSVRATGCHEGSSRVRSGARELDLDGDLDGVGAPLSRSGLPGGH
jgi:hypothetical protein